MTSAASLSSTGGVASTADIQRWDDTLDSLAKSAKACPSAGRGSQRSVRIDPDAIGPIRPPGHHVSDLAGFGAATGAGDGGARPP